MNMKPENVLYVQMDADELGSYLFLHRMDCDDVSIAEEFEGGNKNDEDNYSGFWAANTTEAADCLYLFFAYFGSSRDAFVKPLLDGDINDYKQIARDYFKHIGAADSVWVCVGESSREIDT